MLQQWWKTGLWRPLFPVPYTRTAGTAADLLVLSLGSKHVGVSFPVDHLMMQITGFCSSTDLKLSRLWVVLFFFSAITVFTLKPNLNLEMIRQFKNKNAETLHWIWVLNCRLLIFPFRVMRCWSRFQARLYRRQKKNGKKKNLEKLPVHRWAAMDAGWQTLDCFTFTDNLWSVINQTCIKSELWQVKLSSCRTPRSGDGSFSKQQFLHQSRNTVFLCTLHKDNSSTGKRSGQTRENAWDEFTERTSFTPKAKVVRHVCVSLKQPELLKRSNQRFKWSTIGIAGHPDCSYQSFLLLPESLSKSSKVTARHKSHFRDACCRWASSPCKNVTF